MQVDNKNNTHFTSTMVLAKKLTPEQGIKLVQDFRVFDSTSPFKIYDQPVEKIESITSVLEENNHFVQKYLKSIGVKIKDQIPSFCYFYNKFNKGNVSEALEKTRNYMLKSNWKLPETLDK